MRDFGVRPRPFPKGKVRGYRFEDGLEEAFRRYLPQFNPSPRHDQSATAAQEQFRVSATQSPLPPAGDEPQRVEAAGDLEKRPPGDRVTGWRGY